MMPQCKYLCMAMFVLFKNCFLLILLGGANGLIQDRPMPKLLYECYSNQTRGRDITTTPSFSVHAHCMNYYLTKTFHDRYYKDIDPSVFPYLERLERNLHLNRRKRQARIPLRRRREIRTLSDRERQAFFNAVVALKQDTTVRPNVYDALASLHSAQAIQSAHFGPNFLGWHRYYLYIFEEALRTKDPSVTLPYWDSTFDFLMQLDDPVNSIIWTDRFLGNGNGIVTTGPFAYWRNLDNSFLLRAIGSPGSLMTPDGVRATLSQTFHRDITQPTSLGFNDLEGQHNNVHAWIGGHMAGLTTSPFDPVFFIHHCFIDYIWEQFRFQQIGQGINPQNDYPNTGVEGHWPWSTMANLGRIRNVDGYHNAFTQFVYEYEPSPSFPLCGRSLYLESDPNRRVCMSASNRQFQTTMGPQPSLGNTLGASFASMMRNNQRTASSNNPLELTQNVTDKIRPIFIDPRTQKHANRIKRAVYNPQLAASKARIFQNGHISGALDLSEAISSISIQTPYSEIKSSWSDLHGSAGNFENSSGGNFRHPFSSGRHMTNSYPVNYHEGGNVGSALSNKRSNPNMRANYADVLAVSQRPVISSNSQGPHGNSPNLADDNDQAKSDEFIDSAIQNSFVIDDIADVSRWAFAPVRIIYRRPPGSSFNCKIIKEGIITEGADFYSPLHYRYLKDQVRTGDPETYPRQVQSGSGASKIYVQSDGLTYEGKYVDYAIIDERQPISETVTYVAFKNPKLGNSDSYLSAYDANGRICQPRCLIPGSRPPRYTVCSGVISVTDTFPKMFGNTYGEAVMSRYSFESAHCPNNKDEDIFITFYCDYENQWPWINYPHYK